MEEEENRKEEQVTDEQNGRIEKRQNGVGKPDLLSSR